MTRRLAGPFGVWLMAVLALVTSGCHQNPPSCPITVKVSGAGGGWISLPGTPACPVTGGDATCTFDTCDSNAQLTAIPDAKSAFWGWNLQSTGMAPMGLSSTSISAQSCHSGCSAYFYNNCPKGSDYCTEALPDSLATPLRAGVQAPDGKVWVVGDNSTVLDWTGSQWRHQTVDSAALYGSPTLLSVTTGNNGAVWIAGTNGSLLQGTPQPSDPSTYSWTAVKAYSGTMQISDKLIGVWFDGTATLYVVTQSGGVVYAPTASLQDGAGSWQTGNAVDVGSGIALKQAWFYKDQNVVYLFAVGGVAGVGCQSIQWDSKSKKPVPIKAPTDCSILNGIWGVDEKTIIAVGSRTGMQSLGLSITGSWGNNSWAECTPSYMGSCDGSVTQWNGVWLGAGNEFWVIGNYGQDNIVWHSGLRVPDKPPTLLYSILSSFLPVWSPDGGQSVPVMWIFGNGGTILRYVLSP